MRQTAQHRSGTWPLTHLRPAADVAVGLLLVMLLVRYVLFFYPLDFTVSRERREQREGAVPPHLVPIAHSRRSVFSLSVPFPAV